MSQEIQAVLGEERFQRTLVMVRIEAQRILLTMPSGAIELAELSGYGYVGLMDAWRRFDSSKAIKFETFARHRVRGAMLDGLRSTLGLARRRGYQRLKDQITAWQIVEDQAGACGQNTGPPEVAEATYKQVVELAQSFLRQDLESARSMRPDDIFERCETSHRLSQAVNELEPSEREVIEAVYDLREQGDSGARLAERRGINRSGVCRRHRSILERLRRIMRLDLQV